MRCFQHANKSDVPALIDKNVFYDPVRVVKVQTPYIEIGDDPGYVAACYSDCYSDSDAKCEGDGEVSIDTQPALVDTPASPQLRESFFVEAANPPRRKICVVSPNVFRVDRDEEGNAHAMDGRIINVSKEDIE